MENRNIGLLIAAFVLIIVGASLIGVIATEEQIVTTKTIVSNETHNVLPTIATGRNATEINETITYTLTNAPTGWKLYDCPITTFTLTNSSGTEFTDTTDYIVNLTAGTLTLVDSATALVTLTVTNNNTYATYGYCADGYMNAGWGRSVLDLVPGFFALAVMGIGIALFYGVMKNEGLLGL